MTSRSILTGFLNVCLALGLCAGALTACDDAKKGDSGKATKETKKKEEPKKEDPKTDAKTDEKADEKAEGGGDAKAEEGGDAKAEEGGDAKAEEGGDAKADEGGDAKADEGGDAKADDGGDDGKADAGDKKGGDKKGGDKKGGDKKGGDKKGGDKKGGDASAPKADGKAVYMKKCKNCHGVSGDADTKIGKKNDIPSWKEAGWKGKWSLSKVKNIVTKGKSGTKMKAFKEKLTADEIEAVSRYSRGLGK